MELTAAEKTLQEGLVEALAAFVKEFLLPTLIGNEWLLLLSLRQLLMVLIIDLAV